MIRDIREIERIRGAISVGVLSLLFGSPLSAQHDPTTLGTRMLADPKVRATLDAVLEDEPAVLADQVSLCEIPAPPFDEQARAEAYRDHFERLGLENIRIDAVGNVLGERPGREPRPHLVFSAHLDTVFPEGTDVSVAREGRMLRGPGIGDDCRGLAVVLAVARALDRGDIETTGRITFVGTVGEEGLGDLRGVKHLFDNELAGEVDRFVSVDGAGVGLTTSAVGSHRYRVTYRGPGGHSFGAFGLASPIHALGRLIEAVARFNVPQDPKTTFTVGRIGGGTSVNSIASSAWLEVDLRSIGIVALDDLDAWFRRAVGASLDAENRRWGSGGRLQVDIKEVGRRPAGQTLPEDPLVQAAVAVTEALGVPVRLSAGSTDANIPMSLGIPAITVDGGGYGVGAHSEAEAFDSTDSALGTQRAVLLAVGLTEP